MTSIDAGVEIMCENVYDVQDALIAEERRLRAELDATIDPAARCAVYGRAVINLERQAVAWERRSGRGRDQRWLAVECRRQACLCAVAADIERLRSGAAERGRDLPDPRVLLSASHDDAATEALLALYTAAAR